MSDCNKLNHHYVDDPSHHCGGYWAPNKGTADGAALVRPSAFIPADLSDNLTMNNTAQFIALSADTTKLQITNLGATTEAIRVAFGTSEATAEDNLTIVANAATTGYYIPAIADAGAAAIREIGAPSGSTHVAICNAVAADTQTVLVVQGV